MSGLSAIEVERLDRRRRRVGPGAPHLIGVCGGSGSGKTLVVKAVEDALGKEHVLVIHQDSYYKDLAHLSFEERTKVNFDHPSAFDSELLHQQLSQLLEGKSVRQPVYDFKTHSRSREYVEIKPRDIILLDGILILDDAQVRELMDIRIFMESEADLRLMRRIRRDIQERGRTLESILEQYETFVRPMHDQFVDPSRRWADIIIPHGGMNEIAVDMLITKVRMLVGK